jgi:hypothetical protein
VDEHGLSIYLLFILLLNDDLSFLCYMLLIGIISGNLVFFYVVIYCALKTSIFSLRNSGLCYLTCNTLD